MCEPAVVQIQVRWDGLVIDVSEVVTGVDGVSYGDVAEVLEALHKRAQAALAVGYTTVVEPEG